MRTMPRTLALVALLVAFAAPTEAANILGDVAHFNLLPLSLDTAFDEARAELGLAGHGFGNLIGSPGDVTAGSLFGWDIFVISTPQQPYTNNEITALQNFVATGGGVVVIHDGGVNSNNGTASLNDFLAPYGMAFDQNMVGINLVDLANLPEHCALDGVTTLGLQYARPLATLEAPAAALQTETPFVMGLYDGPSGWVFVIGDGSMWTDSDYGGARHLGWADNLALLLAVFDLADCVDSPVSAGSWSGVKSLY